MERQLLGSLLLLLLQLILASETGGQDHQMSQSTGPCTTCNSVQQTSSTGVTTTLTAPGMTTTTTSTVITTNGTATYVMTPMADTHEGSFTTNSSSTVVTTTRQDMIPPTITMSSISKNKMETTQPASTQLVEAANTTGRRITNENAVPETKATLITSRVPRAAENRDSSTTKGASDKVNGVIKVIPTVSITVATKEQGLIQTTAAINTLLKSSEGTFPTTAASTVKEGESVSKTTEGTPTGNPSHSMWTTTSAEINGPTKTIMSKTNPLSVTLTTITTITKDLETTNATSLTSMTVTESLKEAADVTPTYAPKTTTNAETLGMMTTSETKAVTTVPATADTVRDMISSVATMISGSQTKGRTTLHTPIGSMNLTVSARVATNRTASPTITTLSAGSSGTNSFPIMPVAKSPLPEMSSPCASDEYPSITLERSCICNSSYYAHPEVNNVTVALFCRPWEIEVSLSQCFLKKHGWAQGDALFPGCSGISKIIRGWRVITFVMKRNESTCGLKLSTNISHAVYSLTAQLPSVSHGSETSKGSIDITFSCAYPLVVNVNQKEPSKMANSPHSKIHVVGTGESTITLSFFTDAQHSSLLVDQPVALNTTLYVALEASNADPERFVLVVNAFFASINSSGPSAPENTYYFVQQSCPVSDKLLVQPTTDGDSLKVKLAFRAFRFFSSDVLYYHSRVTLCDKLGKSSCQPNCTRMHQKQRKWVELEYQNKNGSGWLTYGPVRFQDSDPSNNRAPTGPMRIWLTFLLLVVISWTLA
ncbi:uncharacterized protein LOC141563929 [Sminthopsis crassicaudata]|uniref:uncharacterized protein LOC141563929 n=1 Tax=Sminthopsis crassicaudata TaxID=9301 RepID=UPI003D68051C